MALFVCLFVFFSLSVTVVSSWVLWQTKPHACLFCSADVVNTPARIREIKLLLILSFEVDQIKTQIRAVFNRDFAFVLHYRTLCGWLIKLAPLSLVPRLYVFSRAWRRLHVFALISDWFIALFTSLMIGQSNYFGFDFTTLD